MIGLKVLEEKESPINGDIRVVKDLAWGVHIQANGLTQSGGVVEAIWKGTIKKIKKEKPEIKNCLILGIGGGTVGVLIRKHYPNSEIKGIDIDPIMVEMGKKYLGLNKENLKIEIKDAEKLGKDKYDLIIIDLYQGREVPEKFKTDKFLKDILKHLTKNGFAVFNRLYYGEKRPEAVNFLKNLEKIFAKVDVYYPEANIMFLCYN